MLLSLLTATALASEAPPELHETPAPSASTLGREILYTEQDAFGRLRVVDATGQRVRTHAVVGEFGRPSERKALRRYSVAMGVMAVTMTARWPLLQDEAAMGLSVMGGVSLGYANWALKDTGRWISPEALKGRLAAHNEGVLADAGLSERELRELLVREEMLRVGESIDGDLAIYRGGERLSPMEVAWVLGDYGALALYGLGTTLSLGVGAVGAVAAAGGFLAAGLALYSLPLYIVLGGDDVAGQLKFAAAGAGVMVAGAALVAASIGGFQVYASKQERWMDPDEAQERVDRHNQDLWQERAPALDVSLVFSPGGASLVATF